MNVWCRHKFCFREVPGDVQAVKHTLCCIFILQPLEHEISRGMHKICEANHEEIIWNLYWCIYVCILLLIRLTLLVPDYQVWQYCYSTNLKEDYCKGLVGHPYCLIMMTFHMVHSLKGSPVCYIQRYSLKYSLSVYRINCSSVVQRWGTMDSVTIARHWIVECNDRSYRRQVKKMECITTRMKRHIKITQLYLKITSQNDVTGS